MKKLLLGLIVMNLLATPMTLARQSVPTIVISNSKVEQNISNVISSVTIIDQEEIEQSRVQNLADLLKTKAGIAIAKNGGRGQTANVFMRGVANKHTLVLIDGVKASSNIDGTFYWHNLPPSAIERIEIVRGAKSSIYGSDAIGGVIHIFTKKASGLHLNMGGGSFSSKKGTLTFGVNKEHAGFSLNIGKEKSENFSATNQKIGIDTFNPDDDAYENESFNLGLWAKFTNKLKIDASFLSSASETEYDAFHFGGGNFDDLNTTKNKIYSLKFDHEISPKWQQIFTLGKSDIDALFTERTTNTESYRSDASRIEFNWQHNVKFKKNLLVLGADYTRDKAEIDSLFANYSANKLVNKGIYANLSGKFKGFQYGLGLRNDKHDNFGTHTTHQIELGRKLDENWSLQLSHASGFKAPTITELFYPADFMGRPVGNPNLKPEKSKTYEFGLNYSAPESFAKINFFNTKIRGLIKFGTPYENVSQAQIRGFEIQYNKYFGNWKLDLALTLLDSKDDAGKRLVLRPDQQLAAGISRHFSKGYLKLDALFVSERDDMDYSNLREVKLGGYSVFNLAGEYKINPRLALGFRAENILDKEYETVYGYNSPERSAYFDLRYSWD